VARAALVARVVLVALLASVAVLVLEVPVVLAVLPVWPQPRVPQPESSLPFPHGEQQPAPAQPALQREAGENQSSEEFARFVTSPDHPSLARFGFACCGLRGLIGYELLQE
jgi:hypothetical protein